ncbi:hypothetical protein A9Q84_00605 [Halobacteriovorax marinus]|uniref:HTH tetR-type domain-containing protein n=1 Tax=Halobacteriovorax marinus TaxID=97084 RepID=A0A1Y5FBQ0_9BACT|nr:hypothetical protein A9Q84_00605 [Halobacteriovorax marinus]
MGRLKEFELQEALGKAMNVFWKKGYDKTSLKDLLTEMDILNGSFYNTFGNKKSLFLKTLEFYGEEITAKRANHLTTNESFKVGIRSLFEDVFKCFSDKKTPRGCLLVNSLSSELLKDQEVLNFVQTEIANFEEFFFIQLEQAVDSGELDKSINPKLTASILVTYIQGLMKLSSLEISSSKLEKQTSHFLEVIGL